MVGVIFGLAFLGLSFLDSIKVHFGIYAGYLALASLIFYVAFFAIGLGPIPWAVNAEIYPTHVRGLANGIATTANWSSNLLISITFLSYIKLVSASGAFFYLHCRCSCWICFISEDFARNKRKNSRRNF